MEKESYFKKIEHYLNPSVGLKSYLNYILHHSTFTKKYTLKLSDKYFSTLLFINTGTLRLYSIKEEEEITILFWQQNHFIVPVTMLNTYTQTEIYVEFLEETTITTYKDKHTSNLYKLFPEYRELISKIYQQQIAELFIHATALAHQDTNTRFENMMKTNSELFNLCDLKIIANYLGIHPKVLSHLRSKAVKR
jgi:hypothetical protein